MKIDLWIYPKPKGKLWRFTPLSVEARGWMELHMEMSPLQRHMDQYDHNLASDVRAMVESGLVVGVGQGDIHGTPTEQPGRTS